MKILKPSSNYLKNNARKNLALASLLVSNTFILAFLSVMILPIYVNMSKNEFTLGAFSIIPLILGFIYWGKYRSYKLGYEGEKEVTENLKTALSDDYQLINDVILPPYFRGNVDHIVLSPKGVFAVETKNHRGKITCYGDEWLIQFRGKNNWVTERIFNYTLGSPSVQARSNAVRIKNVIDSIEQLNSKRVWVQGIVVFSNNHSELFTPELPESVEVMTLNNLPKYLKDYHGKQQFSIEEMDLMEKEILRQAKT
jgi:hypothetical protein